ncbi:unnamed protein product [Toxocara canis]|uniref:EKA-like protein n=1 Tax=Toxocara canis TaxID=6265 RepID=A0A183UZ20_TOXCA|nr:unnamed protein product [Toxocara canis]
MPKEIKEEAVKRSRLKSRCQKTRALRNPRWKVIFDQSGLAVVLGKALPVNEVATPRHTPLKAALPYSRPPALSAEAINLSADRHGSGSQEEKGRRSTEKQGTETGLVSKSQKGVERGVVAVRDLPSVCHAQAHASFIQISARI